MLRQIPLAQLGLVIGAVLTLVGFAAYAAGNSTLNLVGFFYGFPLLLGGLALKASELKPVPFSQPTPANVLALREQQATQIQTQLCKDVTRYRYGQKAHLDYALNRIGLNPSDEALPDLVGLRETETNGAYTLVLEFDSPLIPLEGWQQKQDKITAYFGPGIRIGITQPAEQRIDLALIVTV